MKYLLSLWLFFCAPLLALAAPPSFLAPNEAFQVSLQLTDDQQLEARFTIAPGYYLYRDRISFSTPVDMGKIQSTPPAGEAKNDPTFGKVEVYKHDFSVPVKAQKQWPLDAHVTVNYQGCAEGGICFPPQISTLRPGESSATSASNKLNQLFNKPQTARNSDTSRNVINARPALFADSWFTTLGLFFVAGLGLAFTACMYPLIPIVSGIVLGGKGHTRRRAIGLSMSYVQGMALTYTGAGLIAAASGAFLAAALQQPWIIASFSLFFVAMALSMFGLYELQLPNALQSRFNALANRLPGGDYAPVFMMGALSALIVGPCMAPPLAAALVYLGQTGDLILGGSALYALALGMGLPLLAIGVFGAGALPKLSAKILRTIKFILGFILLAVAIWMSRPLWQSQMTVSGLDFHPVNSIQNLENALKDAQGQPVMVDFYADWCASCLEFKRETLSDAAVQSQLQAYRLLRADVTDNTEEQQALMRRFNVFGPPTLLFFDATGNLLEHRVIGFEDPRSFVKTLENLKN